MNHKIICLIGMSGSGKSMIQNILSTDMNLHNIISTTTRTMRNREEDHKDYHFVDDKIFKYYIDNDMLVEYREYHTYDENGNNCIWYYGIQKNEPINFQDNIVVVDVKGAKSIVNCYGKENVICIYVDVPYKERSIRSFNRDGYRSVREFQRRESADKNKFESFKKECDLIVDNSDGHLLDSCKTIKKFINGIKFKELKEENERLIADGFGWIPQ